MSSGIIMGADLRELTVLVRLDFSLGLDTTDHFTLFTRLRDMMGISRSV